MEHCQMLVLFVTPFIIFRCSIAEDKKETISYILNNTKGLQRVSLFSWGSFPFMLVRHANMSIEFMGLSYSKFVQ